MPFRFPLDTNPFLPYILGEEACSSVAEQASFGDAVPGGSTPPMLPIL